MRLGFLVMSSRQSSLWLLSLQPVSWQSLIAVSKHFALLARRQEFRAYFLDISATMALCRIVSRKARIRGLCRSELALREGT
ncbi:hypothetical protein B0H66DRAFT_539255, partial [Apodospora peruviana]